MSKCSCIIFPWNKILKAIATRYCFLGNLAKVLLRNFITTHREHCWRIGTTYWWLHRCAMVAGADSPQHLLFHINGTQIAIWASTWYFVTVSLCKCADSPEPSLHASKWNIDTYCIVQWLNSLNRVYAAGVNSTQIAIWTSTWFFVTVTRLWRACANVQTCQSLRCWRE